MLNDKKFDWDFEMSRMRPAIIGLSILALSVPAHAGTELVTNGNFAAVTTPGGASYEIDAASGTATDVTGWTSSGYNFIFTPNEATSTATGGGAYSPQYTNYLTLWGAANGGATGNTWNGNSPQNGNFIASDGDYQTGPITQSISGLTIGNYYLLTFQWAGAQQTGYTGATTEGWTACLGATCNGTGALSNPSKSFTGWQNASFAFKASATTELLSFLAVGTPLGEPPFSLLDGVSLMLDLPEPRDAALLLVGVGALFMAKRKRRPVTV